MSDICNFNAFVEICISRIKNIIDIIIDKQHDPKINLATIKLSRYKAKTVNMLKRNPKAANKIVHLKRVILPLKFINCFFEFLYQSFIIN